MRWFATCHAPAALRTKPTCKRTLTARLTCISARGHRPARNRTGCQQRGFELLFRIYGPTKDFLDKRWVLPDVDTSGGQCTKRSYHGGCACSPVEFLTAANFL